ncbi:MAG: hypothetical protein KAS66_11440 [Candidatus Omnitrophica bacterium]|nr:hypothetical protein [Candidatus Omnitrophota bacterium]
MAMTVECECGTKTEVDFTENNITLRRKRNKILLAEQKCSNPICDKTLFVSGDIVLHCVDTNKFINTKVNWKKVKVGTVVFVDKCAYEIALKSVRKVRTINDIVMKMNILYLRSRSGHYNVVGEVLSSGSIVLIYGSEEPLTPTGYESWHEEKLQRMFQTCK